MPFTPLISRVTLLARPTSVWIRMNALTTSTSLDQGLGASYVKARTGREPASASAGSGLAPQDADGERAPVAERVAQARVGEPEPLVQAGRAVVGLGDPEHHRPRAPGRGPSEHLVDETGAHTAGPPGGVDPHRVQVGAPLLARARADRHADPRSVVLPFGDVQGVPCPLPAHDPRDPLGLAEPPLLLQRRSEGLGCVFQGTQSELAHTLPLGGDRPSDANAGGLHQVKLPTGHTLEVTEDRKSG